MKREAFTHPKLLLVARDLSMPLCYVRGVLVSIWMMTGNNFPRGDIGRLSNEEIAAGIDYPGDCNAADRLIDVLIARRLLDTISDADGRLYVHDWHEHAEKGVHFFLAKNGLYFANGDEPEIPHEKFNHEQRQRIKAEYAKKRECKGTSPGQVPSIPLPQPLPQPKNKSANRSAIPDADDLALARWMFDLIRERHAQPDRKPPNFDQWADDLRLMRERDHRTHEQIRALFERAQADPFWSTNVLSPSKLRERFDDLDAKFKATTNGKPRSPARVHDANRQRPDRTYRPPRPAGNSDAPAAAP